MKTCRTKDESNDTFEAKSIQLWCYICSNTYLTYPSYLMQSGKLTGQTTASVKEMYMYLQTNIIFTLFYYYSRHFLLDCVVSICEFNSVDHKSLF